jgi:hypothetical protein
VLLSALTTLQAPFFCVIVCQCYVVVCSYELRHLAENAAAQKDCCSTICASTLAASMSASLCQPAFAAPAGWTVFICRRTPFDYA